MDIKKLDLNLIVAFDVLLDECNVTRAARRLGMSQPALSSALNRLRDLFQDPLFTRVQRGLVPTERALALGRPVKHILRETVELIRPPVFDPASARREFRLATTDYMFVTLVVPLLNHVQRHAPGLTLSVRSLELSDMPARLARGELDIGITIPEFADDDLRSRHLYTERYVGAVRQHHPLLEQELTVDAFCSYPHTLIVPTGGAARGPVDDALAAIGARRTIGISLPGFLGLPYALRDTDLIAIGPERLFGQMTGDLALFEVPLAIPKFDVIAVWHPRSQNDPGHRWVREKLTLLAARVADAATGTC
jgi:DNA-binding transcriptional LysR family regulator